MARTGASHDRVEFSLPVPPSKDINSVQRAAVKAFGMHNNDFSPWREYHVPVKIRCRPSQFARFLIYRAEKVDVNQFANLNAILIPAETNEFVDVSGQAFS